MIYRLTYIPLAFLFAFLCSCEQSDPPVKENKLVWSDEFSGTALDDTKWEVQIGNGSNYGLWNWGNNEEQYYRAENVTVENGFLKIKAQAEDYAGYKYTSARIRTLEKGDFKYGRVEASIRMDPTGGLWHAFWMLPSHPVESWPVSGEIDIMEYIGNAPDGILNYIHFADRFGNHQQLGSSTSFFADNNFHVYAMEWNANKITWYFDEIETFSALRSNDQISSTWPFDAEFHILLNTAIGGNLGGQVNSAALAVPRYLEVDWVRVYQNI